MAIITTRINGSSSQAGYGYYANVLVWDNIQANNTFTVQVNTYLVNNGSRFSTSGWTKHTRIDNVDAETLTNQSIDTTGADRYGGETLIHSKTYSVPVTLRNIWVVSYLSKGSYASYEPGYCELASWVSMPNVMSMWNSSLLSLPDITQSFTLPITKYINDYYNVVEVRNGNNSVLVKTINDAMPNDSVTFTSSELNAIYTMDNNANQLPLKFYMDLKTYTNSSKTTQIGSTQRLTCEAYLVNSEPTFTQTVVEQDSAVITLLGSSTSDKVVAYTSDLLFTITPTAKNGATIKSVKVNDMYATYDSDNQVYTLNTINITTGTFNIVVTDSRNLETPYQITKTLLDFIPINIHSDWTVERTSQVDDDVNLNAKIDIWSGTVDGKQTYPTVQYSIDNENWATIPSSSYTHADNLITISNYVIQDLVSYDTTATFYLRAVDVLWGNQDSRTITKGIETFSYGESDFQINGELILADENGNNGIDVNNGIIQEINSNYNGTYIKYTNGILICYTSTSTQNCNGYAGASFDVTLPSTFIDTTYVTLANIRGGGAYWANINDKAYPVTTSTLKVDMWNNGSTTAEGISYNVMAIGKWK